MNNMSRQEYMTKLIDALKDFDDEIREEIINDYEDHFVNGLRSGKTEDEIANELGSIDELVSDLNALSGKNETTQDEAKADGAGEKKTDFSEDASAKINDMIKSFASFIGEMAAGINKGSKKVSSTVGDGAKEFADGAKEFANNFASGFMKGYENFAQGVGNMADKVKSSEFAQGVSESYKRAMNGSSENEDDDAQDITKTAGKDDEIDDFELDDIENIAGQPVDDDDLDEDEGEFVSFSEDVENLVIEADSAEVYLDESDDGNLNINYENDGNPNQKLVYRFECKQKGKTLYATVKKQPGISNFFQTLGCPDISLYVGLNDSLKKVSVKTMSGDVNANEIGVEQLKINSMSGDINIEDSSITVAELQTMSGDIDVSMDAATSITMSSISGDLDFEGYCESIHAKTTSGDVDFTIENENSDITVSSVSGDINIDLSNDSGYVANAKTTAGSITLSCGDEEKEVIRSGNYIMGNGGARLTLSSISGDIDVDA